MGDPLYRVAEKIMVLPRLTIVMSTSPSHLEAHVGFFKLSMKGKFDVLFTVMFWENVDIVTLWYVKKTWQPWQRHTCKVAQQSCLSIYGCVLTDHAELKFFFLSFSPKQFPN